MGKHKKDKKLKKHKKKKDSSSSDDSDVSWKEASPEQKDVPKQLAPNWLAGGGEGSDVGDLLSVFTKDQSKREKKPQNPPEVEMGKHDLELNPYFKQGGSGLPSSEKTSIRGEADNRSNQLTSTAWLRRSYQRAEDMAKEEGCSVESYLIQRWEPATVQRMLSLFGPGSDSRNRNKFSRPDNDYEKDNYGRQRSNHRRFTRPDRDDNDRKGNCSSFIRGSHPTSRSRPDISNTRSSQIHPERQTAIPRWKKSSEIQKSSRPNWKRQTSRSPHRRSRSRSPRRRSRSGSQRRRSRSGSPRRRSRSGSPRRRSRSRSPRRRSRSGSPRRRSRSGSPQSRSRSGSPQRRSRSGSPQRRSRSGSPRRRSRSGSPLKSKSPIKEKVEQLTIIEEEKEVTDEDINKIAAQIIRAEIMGNTVKLSKLKANLAKLRDARERGLKIRVKTTQKQTPASQTVLLSRVNRAGVAMPLLGNSGDPSRKGATKVETHDSEGQRINYFHNEDKLSLKDLMREERMTSSADSNRTFATLAGKAGENTDEGEYRDSFVKPKARLDKEEAKEKTYALKEHKIHGKSLAKCDICIEKLPKHLIISRGEKCYLYLPEHTSITEHYCILAPLQHTPSSTLLDEDVWTEMTHFKKQLVDMFDSLDEDCVIMETAFRLNKFPHMRLECVPMPRDCGDMAPVYFKKALQDAGPEWAQNKKIVELKGGDIRRSVPKGFPYFSVEFGRDGGFAHVIENEESFVPYFGREILAGILDKGPEFWRHPSKENFKQQSSKVINFESVWKPFNMWQEEDKD